MISVSDAVDVIESMFSSPSYYFFQMDTYINIQTLESLTMIQTIIFIFII